VSLVLIGLGVFVAYYAFELAFIFLTTTSATRTHGEEAPLGAECANRFDLATGYC
jgi:hypothetical protein